MKKISILVTILFSMIFTFPSYGNWVKVGQSADQQFTYYVDYNKVKKRGDYLFYWELEDYSKPDFDFLSSLAYRQVDCSQFRFKNLSFIMYASNMGKGDASPVQPRNKGWIYPPPNSVSETSIEKVCKK